MLKKILPTLLNSLPKGTYKYKISISYISGGSISSLFPLTIISE